MRTNELRPANRSALATAYRRNIMANVFDASGNLLPQSPTWGGRDHLPRWPWTKLLPGERRQMNLWDTLSLPPLP